MIPTTSPHESLRRYFPDVAGFRDCQEIAIERIWEGKSSLVLMPTGKGKSLIFQLPVMASGKIGIVISPLIALMQQQATKLKEIGANVLSLGGAADAKAAQEALKKFQWNNGAGFIFISPERAETDGYLEFLLRKNRERIGLVAIDEAHCISQWGHDFRPPYKSLPGIFDRSFGRDAWPAIVCLTATLDERCQQEIVCDFRLTNADVVKSDDMLRSNLALSFQTYGDSEAKREALEELLESHRGEKIIVYAHRIVSKMNGTRALADHFSKLKHRCKPFDSHLSMAEKDQLLSEFEAGDVDVVFATGAFGMGVDIPDIRGVIHYLLPESIEQYYQEVGRAGRDQKPAFGTLLYCNSNSRIQRQMIETARKTEDQVREIWDNVCNVARADVKTLSPWVAFQGKEDEYALFYAFARIDAVRILARGTGRLKSFEPSGREGEKVLCNLNAATKTGQTRPAAEKLQLDISSVINELFDLYDRSEIKLSGSPDKTLFFRTRPLTESEIKQVTSEINEKVDFRLEKFEELVSIIEAGVDPTDSLRQRFGTLSAFERGTT